MFWIKTSCKFRKRVVLAGASLRTTKPRTAKMPDLKLKKDSLPGNCRLSFLFRGAKGFYVLTVSIIIRTLPGRGIEIQTRGMPSCKVEQRIERASLRIHRLVANSAQVPIVLDKGQD